MLLARGDLLPKACWWDENRVENILKALLLFSDRETTESFPKCLTWPNCWNVASAFTIPAFCQSLKRLWSCFFRRVGSSFSLPLRLLPWGSTCRRELSSSITSGSTMELTSERCFQRSTFRWLVSDWASMLTKPSFYLISLAIFERKMSYGTAIQPQSYGGEPG